MSLIKNKLFLIFFSLSISIIITVYTTMYTVPEGYTAFLIHSGIAEKNPPISPLGPGLHVKLPFTRPTQIDMRLHSFTSKKSTFISSDKQALVIDYYVAWRVVNPIRYAQTPHNQQQTTQQLTQKINTILQNKLANYTREAITSTLQTEIFPHLRLEINTQIKTLGLSLVDIAIHSIDFSPADNETLLKNMRAEQLRLALEQQALGKTNAETIRQHADSQATLLLTQAQAEAATIRGEGDADAAKIYNTAYRKNPQFAAFYLNLEALRKGFIPSSSSNNNNTLVFTTKDDPFTDIKESLRHKN